MGRIVVVSDAASVDYRAVIETAREQGMLDELLLSPACQDHDTADQMRRDLLHSARRYCSCGKKSCSYRYKNYPTEKHPDGGCPNGGQRISGRAEVVTVTDGNGRKRYHVQFQLHDKQESIRALILQYGPDPANWPYNPRARQLKGKAYG